MNYNYYELLDVKPNASPEEIRIAYRKLAKHYHPDISKAPNAQMMFRLINDAHEILTDPNKRARYDYDLNISPKANKPKPDPSPEKPERPKTKPDPAPKQPEPTKTKPSESEPPDYEESIFENFDEPFTVPPHATQKKQVPFLARVFIFIIVLIVQSICMPLKLLSPVIKFLYKCYGVVTALMTIAFFFILGVEKISPTPTLEDAPTLINCLTLLASSILLTVLGFGGHDVVLSFIDDVIYEIEVKCF